MRTENAEFGSLSLQEEGSKALSVMNGPALAVFVHRKAKADPTPEEVVAEYRGG